MPRTIKGTDSGKRHPLNMRTTKETREWLEAAAAENGHSLAHEVEIRLERSRAQERAFGGPKLQRVADRMIIAFINAGELHAAGDPDWIDDRDSYLAGVFGVIEALLAGIDLSPDDVTRHTAALKGRLLTLLVNRGRK